jgi:hypothetical protein
MTLSLDLPQIPQEDAVRFLQDQGLPADTIHQRLVDLFGVTARGYLSVTYKIRQLYWTVPEMLKGRPTNFSIDVAILKVLNGDPTASVREIEQETKPSTLTIFYVLTTPMGHICRTCRLVPDNVSEPQKTDRLRHSHELLEILQNVKRLLWQVLPGGR